MKAMEHSRSRHKWLLFLAVWLGLSPSTAYGQSVGSIEQLEVALWPEYDRQAVLVIYRFRLKADGFLPAKVTLPIPATVGRPHAVAWRNESGGLMVADYERIVEDDRALILINMRSLEGQLEYYADLTLEGRRRTFLFSWLGGVDLSALSFKVQRPSGALGFETVPPRDRSTVGQDGFTYDFIDHGPLKTEDKPTIELTYEKDSPALSSQAPEPSQTSRPPQPVREVSADDNLLPWFLGGFAGVLLGLVASRLWRSSPTPPEPSQAPRRRKKKGIKTAKKSAGNAAANFCHNCGAKAQTHASFCMSCGTRLRQKPLS